MKFPAEAAGDSDALVSRRESGELAASFAALGESRVDVDPSKQQGLPVGHTTGAFLLPGEIIVDNFAGGGGASTGIEAAFGSSIDIAVNHSPEAITVHRANHPQTDHLIEDVWKVNPVEACQGRPVGLAWFSPTCTHFSRAKGAALLDRKIRALAWVVIRWARAVRPRVVMLENVEEFEEWGPLDNEGRPIKAKAGTIFRLWVTKLRELGYNVEFRSLVAADYGAPTTRRRLFLIARCDGLPIVWPEPTHGPGRAQPWRTAAEIIDWSLPCPSIFGRKRPLADATLRRVAVGVQRFVLDAAQPFIVRHGHYSTITGAGLREGCGAGTFRGQPLTQPLATVCATNDKHLVVPFIAKHYGGVYGHDLSRPLGTVTAKDHHSFSAAFLSRAGERSDRADKVRALLEKYRLGAEDGRELGTLTIKGELYRVVDIGMRMLSPLELFAAQGFPASYVIDPVFNGKPISKTDQTRLAGNSVCPQVSEALVRANFSIFNEGRACA